MTLDELTDAVNRLTGAGGSCHRLVHLYIPGQARPSATPGCAECAELQQRYDMAPPSAPKAAQSTKPTFPPGLEDDDL